MTTAIPLTLHLLVLIGLYELAAGIAGLTGRIDWLAMIDEFERSPALTFVTGFVAFALRRRDHPRPPSLDRSAGDHRLGHRLDRARSKAC